MTPKSSVAVAKKRVVKQLFTESNSVPATKPLQDTSNLPTKSSEHTVKLTVTPTLVSVSLPDPSSHLSTKNK